MKHYFNHGDAIQTGIITYKGSRANGVVFEPNKQEWQLRARNGRVIAKWDTDGNPIDGTEHPLCTIRLDVPISRSEAIGTLATRITTSELCGYDDEVESWGEGHGILLPKGIAKTLLRLLIQDQSA